MLSILGCSARLAREAKQVALESEELVELAGG